ncbi:hypothetical protein ACX6XY_19695 [Streptomyces sp. O3]
MNRNALRMAAVSAVAAVALGGTAGLAQASQASEVTTRTVSVTQQAETQQAARALLASPLAASLSTAERAEVNAIASGQVTPASKWDLIWKAFSKVKGFAKAVAGSYKTFKAWYNDLSWWQKLPLRAVMPGMTLWDIYQHFH